MTKKELWDKSICKACGHEKVCCGLQYVTVPITACTNFEEPFEDALPFQQGYSAGRYDGYMACHEKWLDVIDSIKTELTARMNEADKHSHTSNAYSVRERLRARAQELDDALKFMEQKIAEAHILNER